MAALNGWTMGDKAIFGQYGAGSTSDKTNLKTVVYLKRDGKNQPSSVATAESGGKAVNFTDAKKGDVIDWRVETLCDGDPTSDRVNVTLTYYDPAYIAGLSSKVLDQLSDAEITQVLNGDSTPVEEKLKPLLDVGLAIKQVYSTTVITDSEGKAAGEIPISDAYPWSDYTLTIHYGYAGLAERSDDDKAWEFFIEEVVIGLGEIVLIVAAIIVSGGTLGFVLGLAATAAGLAEIGLMASSYLASGFGAIDENRKGCLFPAMGWNHTYNFVLDEPVEVIDPETGEPEESTQIEQAILANVSPDVVAKIDALKETYGFGAYSTGTVLGIVGLFTVVAAVILLRGGGDSDE